jgi:hypothetical protein
MAAGSTRPERGGFDHLREHSNWVAIAYTVIGIVLTVLVVRFAPQRLTDVDHVYVDDETFGEPTA